MATAIQGTDELKIAHVLFMDLVGYSRPPMDDKTRILCQLQNLVAATTEFCRAKASDRLISLPTGDGMALVFFEDPTAPLRCAREIARELKNNPDIQLRMGIHSGPVYRLQDINANMNVAGGGINIAQRVMDCGDSGHILLSDTVAGFVGQLSEWSGHLHDLGAVTVKHGGCIHLYNYSDGESGNPSLPDKLRAQSSQRRVGLVTRMSAAIALAVLLIGLVIFLVSSQSSNLVAKAIPPPVPIPAGVQAQAAADVLKLVYNGSPPPAPAAAAVPQLQFTIVAKQKGETTFSALKDGDALASEADDYLFVVRPWSTGYLYVFQVDASGKTQGLFPENNAVPFSSGSNPVKPEQILQVPSSDKSAFFLDTTTGIEHIYVVFSATRWLELETALSKPASPSLPSSSTFAAVQNPNNLRSRGVQSTRVHAAKVNMADALSAERVYQGAAYKLPITGQPLEASGTFFVVERWFRHVNTRP